MATDRDDQLAREIRAHLELEAEERIAGGEPPQQAHDSARRAFGNVARIREDARAVWVPAWLEQGRQDVRHAARRLVHAPAFALTAIVILSLGVGLNVGFFQVLNAIALRPLAVADVDTLVRFDRVSRQFSSNGVPYPATQFVRANNTVLSAVLTSHAADVAWDGDSNDRLDALYVSANWFGELGYSAAQGRVFSELLDGHPGAPAAAVVSHRFWQARLGGEAVVGRSVRLNDRPATIVGVAPAAFPGLRLADTDIWLPINQVEHFNPGMRFADDWASHNTQLYGRLRQGVSAVAAREGLRTTMAQLAAIRPAEFEPDESLMPYGGRERFRGPRDRAELRTVALLVGALTLTILVVACANLGSLLLAQTLNRAREFSLRAALGASRWRVVRQQLAETGVLAAAGAAAGLLVGYWGARLAATSVALPASADLTVDWRTLAALGLVGCAAMAAVGIAPVWMTSRRDIVPTLRDGGHQASPGLARARFRIGLVGLQVAGCCLLLTVAVSAVQGVRRMIAADVGFEFAAVAVLDPALPRAGIRGEAAAAYWADVQRLLAASGEVEQIALASHAPLGNRGGRSVYSDAPSLSVSTLTVEPSFFALLRIPIVAGRSFESGDDAARAVIVSRTLALRMYGTLDVIGKGFPRSGPDRTIVGVAADAHLANVAATNVAEQYWPAGPGDAGRLLLLARARNRADRLLLPLASAARRADARVLPRTWLPTARFDEQVQTRRTVSALAALSGLLALALACFGLFALVAQNVTARAREIGIRRALGAGPRAILVSILRRLAAPVAAGAGAGMLASIGLGTLLEGEPFFLPPIGPATLAAAVVTFVLAAGFVTLLPARRAFGPAPLEALRGE